MAGGGGRWGPRDRRSDRSPGRRRGPCRGGRGLAAQPFVEPPCWGWPANTHRNEAAAAAWAARCGGPVPAAARAPAPGPGSRPARTTSRSRPSARALAVRACPGSFAPSKEAVRILAAPAPQKPAIGCRRPRRRGRCAWPRCRPRSGRRSRVAPWRRGSGLGSMPGIGAAPGRHIARRRCRPRRPGLRGGSGCRRSGCGLHGHAFQQAGEDGGEEAVGAMLATGSRTDRGPSPGAVGPAATRPGRDRWHRRKARRGGPGRRSTWSSFSAGSREQVA